MFINAIASASYGIQQNLQRFNTAAERIANPEFDAGVNEIMELKQAEKGIKVNAAVIRSAHRLSEYVVDILA
jgi:flagellar basal body rod protein FlgC